MTANLTEETNSYNYQEDIADRQQLRRFRKVAFWSSFWISLLFLLFFVVELVILFFGNTRTDKQYALDVLAGITASVGVILALGCVRLAASSNRKNSDEMEAMGIVGTLALLAKKVTSLDK